MSTGEAPETVSENFVIGLGADGPIGEPEYRVSGPSGGLTSVDDVGTGTTDCDLDKLGHRACKCEPQNDCGRYLG